jgi:hypothetical protein
MAVDEGAPVPLEKPDMRGVALIDDVPEDWVLLGKLREPLPAFLEEASAVLMQPLRTQEPYGTDAGVWRGADTPDANRFAHVPLVAQDVALTGQLDAAEQNIDNG